MFKNIDAASGSVILADTVCPFHHFDQLCRIDALRDSVFLDALHALGCLIGKFPSVALEVILGHDVVNFGDNSLRLTIIIIAVAIIYGGIWWYTKKRKK